MCHGDSFRALRERYYRLDTKNLTSSGAILDRFLHHSIRVCFKGQSYRQRHMRQERLSANPDKATFAKKMTTE
ncbi:ATP-binding protein [Duodenibacillus massiliensis]|uniref:ATP-binding protein n=1 Tax=Duodenibacillus massiliensis TaxID=1852381 RepID=UPI003A93C319